MVNFGSESGFCQSLLIDFSPRDACILCQYGQLCNLACSVNWQHVLTPRPLCPASSTRDTVGEGEEAVSTQETTQILPRAVGAAREVLGRPVGTPSAGAPSMA